MKTTTPLIISLSAAIIGVTVFLWVRDRTDYEGRIKILEREFANKEREMRERLAGTEAQFARSELKSRKLIEMVGKLNDETTRAKVESTIGDSSRLDSPQTQLVIRNSIKSQLGRRNERLFGQLQIPPADLEKLKDIMAEFNMTMLDITKEASRAGHGFAGLDGLVTQFQSERDSKVRPLLSGDAFSKYEEYVGNSEAYSVLDRIANALAASGESLTSEQSQQLLSITKRLYPTNSVREAAMLMASPMVARTIQPELSDALLTGATAVLSREQSAILRRTRDEARQDMSLLGGAESAKAATPSPYPER